MEKVSFKNYLSSLVDEALPEDEKKEEKTGKKKAKKALPTGILQYLQLANAAEE